MESYFDRKAHNQSRRRHAVKGIVCLLALCIWSTSAYAGEPVDCAYCPEATTANPQPETQEFKNCGTIEGGRLSLSKETVKKLSYDRHGLATVLVRERHYYVRRDGSTLRVVTFDNGPDYYSEGLVRSSVNGKTAYFDRKLRQVIPPRYDWGGPFVKGRALVCTGCTIGPADEDGHSSCTGGLWGYIDQKGKEVVPVRFSRSEAERM